MVHIHLERTETGGISSEEEQRQELQDMRLHKRLLVYANYYMTFDLKRLKTEKRCKDAR